MEYVQHIAVLASIFAILTLSLDLVLGHTGLLSLAHAAFFGIGAYCCAVLTRDHGIPWLLAVPIAIVGSFAFGAIVSYLLLRLREDSFAVATFGLQMIVFSVLLNWTSVTSGPFGIPNISEPQILRWTINTTLEFLVLALLLLLLVVVVVKRLVDSPFGRVLHAVREDEDFARSLGKNVYLARVSAFSSGAAIAALAGCVFAPFMSYIHPTNFTLMDSVLILSMVIIGGAGSILGAILGAVALVVLPEALRYLGMPVVVAANVRQILYGTALIVMMIWRPQGLLGRFALRE